MNVLVTSGTVLNIVLMARLFIHHLKGATDGD